MRQFSKKKSRQWKNKYQKPALLGGGIDFAPDEPPHNSSFNLRQLRSPLTRWLEVMCRMFSGLAFHYLTARLQGSEVRNDRKARPPLLGHWLSRRPTRLHFAVCSHLTALGSLLIGERSSMQTELSCSRHLLARKKKLWKHVGFLLRVVYQLAVERSANTSLTQRSEALKCYLRK